MAQETFKPNDTQKFSIVPSFHEGMGSSNPCSFYDLVRLVDDHKPEKVILCTFNMHGKTIVSLLEFLLSKKYKPQIYDFIFHRT